MAPRRMTLREQRAIAKALPRSRVLAARKYCRDCQMRGGSFSSIWKSIKKYLGPVVSEIGPKVAKEILLPLAIKTAKSYAGLGCGGKLAPKKGRESARVRRDRAARRRYAMR